MRESYRPPHRLATRPRSELRPLGELLEELLGDVRRRMVRRALLEGEAEPDTERDHAKDAHA